MPASQSDSTRRVREQIEHPVIDSDGHVLEFLPAVREILREKLGDKGVEGFQTILNAQQTAKHLDPAIRRNLGLFRLTWWGFPARNSLDRATAPSRATFSTQRCPCQGVRYSPRDSPARR